MKQIFSRSANAFARASIIGAVLLIGAAIWLGLAYAQSPYVTGQDVVRAQPVPFSHKHHVGELGLDCRYCHTAVEDSASAGMPATEVCMQCHSQIWKDSPVLAPVRDSYKNGTPIMWTRVDYLPDYVYFDHSIHVAKGVACVSCHGQVDEMPLTWQSQSLIMTWCLDCHRNPTANIRPREAVFDMNWQPPTGIDLAALRQTLAAEYNVQSKTSCSTCHR